MLRRHKSTELFILEDLTFIIRSFTEHILFEWCNMLWLCSTRWEYFDILKSRVRLAWRGWSVAGACFWQIALRRCVSWGPIHLERIFRSDWPPKKPKMGKFANLQVKRLFFSSDSCNKNSFVVNIGLVAREQSEPVTGVKYCFFSSHTFFSSSELQNRVLSNLGPPFTYLLEAH